MSKEWELSIPPDERIVLDMTGVLSKSAVEQVKQKGFMEMKSFELSVSYNLVQESPVER
jgi:hypothetical protein